MRPLGIFQSKTAQRARRFPGLCALLRRRSVVGVQKDPIAVCTRYPLETRSKLPVSVEKQTRHRSADGVAQTGIGRAMGRGAQRRCPDGATRQLARRGGRSASRSTGDRRGRVRRRGSGER